MAKVKKIMCWGDNSYGQLGLSKDIKESVVPVPIPIMNFTSIVGELGKGFDVGKGFVCAVTTNEEGLISCVGTGLPDQSTVAINEYLASRNIGLSNIKQIVAGNGFACVVLDHKEIVCWGKNRNGMLLSGNEFDRYEAYRFPSHLSIQDFQVSDNNACYMLQNEKKSYTYGIYCAGTNEYGQLGQGLNSSEILTLPEVLKRGPIPLERHGWLPNEFLTLSNERICSGIRKNDELHLYCWGLSLDGQENIGDEPDEISELESFDSIPISRQDGGEDYGFSILLFIYIPLMVYSPFCVLWYCCKCIVDYLEDANGVEAEIIEEHIVVNGTVVQGDEADTTAPAIEADEL